MFVCVCTVCVYESGLVYRHLEGQIGIAERGCNTSGEERLYSLVSSSFE